MKCQFKTQSYLCPESNISSEDMFRILKCRIRDLDVKGNFVNSYKDTKCPFNLCSSYESQSHLAHCTFYPENTLIPNGLKYQDMFKDDIGKVFQIMRILVSRTEIRSKLIESQHHKNVGPEDPRRVRKPVSRVTSKGTSGQALSLVIRGRRRKHMKSLRASNKNNNNKNTKGSCNDLRFI